MPTERIETVVIGAGQAGLAMSHHLSRFGAEHVVLERGRIAQRWRSERWDSLCFQSPNWNMNLPGWPRMAADPQADPDAFSPLAEVTHYLDRYAAAMRVPVREGCEVRSLGRAASGRLHVHTGDVLFEARNVVVATGPYQVPRPTPALGRAVFELHATQYRNPALLPPGGVLVVGAGNSGVQIADELSRAQRRVFLSVSAHERIRRRHRGRDCIWWLIATGSTEATLQGWTGARLSRLMTGVDGGYDMDLRRLASQGVVLLGRVKAAEDGRLDIADDLLASIAHGDESLAAFTRRCDDVAREQKLDVLPEEPSEEAWPDPPELRTPLRTLDLAREAITCVIWANGALTDFRWIELPVFADEQRRKPMHVRGITNEPGLYFLGLPWLHKWKSAFLFGADEDAAHLAQHIAGAA